MSNLTPLLKLSLVAQRLEAAIAHLQAARNPFEYGPALAGIRESKLLIEAASHEMQEYTQETEHGICVSCGRRMKTVAQCCSCRLP